VAVPEGEEEDQADDRERHDGGGDRLGYTRPDQPDADEGKVERHRQVLEDEQREQPRRLGFGHATEVADHLRDDSRGGDVGDAAEHERPDQPPAHQKPDDEARREVQREIEDPDSDAASQPGGELERAVLEPKREEEQDDPHLAQGRDQHIVARRRRERSQHDPGDEIEPESRRSPCAPRGAHRLRARP
jgi:hypothetical protein